MAGTAGYPGEGDDLSCDLVLLITHTIWRAASWNGEDEGETKQEKTVPITISYTKGVVAALQVDGYSLTRSTSKL
ncbi:hypothetical protein CYMTET_11048 [Cymbomonas tetramitiformis]|uniref:Uncharacterized protein n=1 Tax=Cymbomonas tetramitiformis TaxID=36881 RepID=A0AAE0GLB0_9CHLO|nr:hypothetical protein CYMTET_11970 [Cymbomonas tetramitiformis]KAK3281148.1 hypothetical protein CYMTET_11048 [Cymbomonas tetramitiformis]